MSENSSSKNKHIKFDSVIMPIENVETFKKFLYIKIYKMCFYPNQQKYLNILCILTFIQFCQYHLWWKAIFIQCYCLKTSNTPWIKIVKTDDPHTHIHRFYVRNFKLCYPNSSIFFHVKEQDSLELHFGVILSEMFMIWQKLIQYTFTTDSRIPPDILNIFPS